MNIQLQSEQLAVSINSFGAEMCSVKNPEGLEFIWQANKEIWPRHAPVLFPIVGKLKDNTFVYKTRSYELAQHGFARDSEFELLNATNDSCTFQLVSDKGSKKKYPFDFVFQINYTLVKNKLIVLYTVFNHSSETIFFSVGAHPGFKCPLLEEESFEDYYLEFDSSDKRVTQINEGLRLSKRKKLELKNNHLSLSKTLFNNDALVFENHQIDRLSLCSIRSDHKISLECKNWPYFGIWSKKGSTDFICLEPWFGIADRENSDKEFTKKEGLMKLETQKDFMCSFSLSFE